MASLQQRGRLQEVGNHRWELAVVVNFDESEIGLEDGFVVAAEAVVVSAVAEFIVAQSVFAAVFLQRVSLVIRAWREIE